MIPTLLLSLVACSDKSLDDTAVAAVAEFGLSQTLTVVATGEDGLDVPRDIAWHPERTNELWTVNRAFDGTVTFFDPGTDAQVADERKDTFRNHFMEEVSSLAFGAATWTGSTEITFATCHESRNTYDDLMTGDGFMGPALWPSDLEYYAEANQDMWGMLAGSHLDMLHGSPFCMGIEWEKDNVYWVFDGKNDHLVYYDFVEDHDLGYDDHSDGIIRRYPEVELTRVEDVPGHLALDHDTGWLYIADTGTGRILRVDTATGEKGGLPAVAAKEPLAEYIEMLNVTWEVFAEGLEQPSGLAVYDGRLFAADHLTGEILAWDLDGNLLDTVATDAAGIMGIDVGPDGQIWYVDGLSDAVVRVDPEG